VRDVRPEGHLEWVARFPSGSKGNGGVIITDFVNLTKGKIGKNLGRIQSSSAGEWRKPDPRVVKKLSHS